MADLDERPSKIRKINPPRASEDASRDVVEDSTLPLGTSPTDLEETTLPFNDDSTPQEPNAPGALSKSQLKKLRKRAAWDASKDDRRALRKQKEKEKKQRKASARSELQAKIAAGELPPPAPVAPPKYARPQQVPVGLILDCDFNEMMTEKELISLGSQLTRSYSENRGAGFRTHLAISSWGGKLKERFETVLNRNHDGWKGVMFLEEGFVEAAKMIGEKMGEEKGGDIVGALKDYYEDIEVVDSARVATQKAQTIEVAPLAEKDQDAVATATSTKVAQTNEVLKSHHSDSPSLVYLSSDSPNTLTTLAPFTTYVIGGIVDKNRYKGLCQQRATDLGIPTAKLPIGEFMVMNSRAVLAVNHVVEIMLRWLECGDWGEAFEMVIPKRKGAVLRKGSGAEGAESAECGEVEEEGAEDEHEEGYYEVKEEKREEDYVPRDEMQEEGGSEVVEKKEA